MKRINGYDISVIIPLRNTEQYHRNVERLGDVLSSLRNQTVLKDRIELIISDIDSEPKYREKHKEICKKYNARHVYTETGQLWNISKARNIGIRNANGKYVMTTDVDCVFTPNFIEAVLKKITPNMIIHCRMSELKEGYEGRLDDFELMRKNLIRLRPTYGYGSCQIVSRDWAFKVRGFDEEYETWGAEDTDFYYRAKQDGLDEVWIENEATYFHQWHSQGNRDEDRLRLTVNRQRCRLTEIRKLPLARNPYGWGSVPAESKFPDTALIITTFLRDDNLFDCVKSIKKYYPGLAIYVADGGNPSDKKTDYLKKHYCTHIQLPFDTGVCGSRNEALKQVPDKYKYILVCEDDIVFTPESKIEIWRKILDHDKSLGIIGGAMMRVQHGKQALQHYEGFLSIKDDTCYIHKAEKPKWMTINSNLRYYTCDIILNVFLMRREIHDDIKWDAKIPQAPEHLDFFLSLKRWSNWKVGYTDNFQMNHVQLGYEENYIHYRQRNQGFRHFARKHGIRYVYSDWHSIFKASPYPDRVDYLNWKLTDGAVLINNLIDMRKILNGLGCKWWLANGTCLGAVRDKSFLRHTDNLDIMLAPGQIKLWDELVKEFKKAKFELHKEWKYKNKRLSLVFQRDDKKINLFFLFQKKEQCWHGFFSPDGEFVPYVFPKELFSDIKAMKFLEMECFAPGKTEQYLEAVYGRAWKVPVGNYKSWEDSQAIDYNFFNKEKIAFIPGKWETIHVGHLDLFERAKKLGAKITIGILTDAALGKESKHRVPYAQRKAVVEALRATGEVIKLNDRNFTQDLMKIKLKPNYLVYGDNHSPIPGEDYIKKYNGKVVRFPILEITRSVKPSKEYKSDEVIAVGIKTFLREELLFKTLKALEGNMPYPYRLYIADDGKISDKKEYLYQKLEEEGHAVFRMPFNSGLSAGRNAIIKNAKEDYILIMDDDILVKDSQTIEKMKRVLDGNDKLGLVAGMIYLENGNFLACENYQKGLNFEFKQGMLFRHPSKKLIQKTDGGLMYIVADQVVNFFLAKRELFTEVKWDDRIKIEWEHIDFFLSLAKTRWKAAVCLDTKVIHQAYVPDFIYNQHRRNAPSHYFKQKNELHNVINRFQ